MQSESLNLLKELLDSENYSDNKLFGLSILFGSLTKAFEEFKTKYPAGTRLKQVDDRNTYFRFRSRRIYYEVLLTTARIQDWDGDKLIDTGFVVDGMFMINEQGKAPKSFLVMDLFEHINYSTETKDIIRGLLELLNDGKRK